MKVPIEKPGTPQELVHFGKKGMHWGIRNESTSSPELKKAAQKAIKEKTGPLIDIRVNQMFNVKPLTMNDYKNMSTRPTVIPSGKPLYRLTRDPKDISLPGHTYVSTNKRDATIYKGLLPSQRLLDQYRKSDYKTHYEVTLKTKKTLKGPSEKERVDILASLMDDKTALNGKMSLRQYYKKSGQISGREARNDSSLELALKMHRRVHQNMFVRKDAISQTYMNAIRKKGYDVISDDNDKNIIAKNPMIILNPKTAVSKTGTTRLSNNDILKAQIDLKFPVAERR